MFAPVPRTEDGWYIMRGTLRDGSIVNLWQPDVSLPVEKPASVSDTYLTQRWRKYLDNLTRPADEHYHRYFGNWLRRRWNQRSSSGKRQREVVKIELIYRLEHTPEPGEPFPELKSVPLWTMDYE